MYRWDLDTTSLAPLLSHARPPAGFALTVPTAVELLIQLAQFKLVVQNGSACSRPRLAAAGTRIRSNSVLSRGRRPPCCGNFVHFGMFFAKGRDESAAGGN